MNQLQLMNSPVEAPENRSPRRPAPKRPTSVRHRHLQRCRLARWPLDLAEKLPRSARMNAGSFASNLFIGRYDTASTPPAGAERRRSPCGISRTWKKYLHDHVDADDRPEIFGW